MFRLHIDDIRDAMCCDTKRKGATHFNYVKIWLEESRALIVQADPVRTPNNFMPGTFAMRSGIWGVDEPFPPFNAYREMLAAAQGSGPKSR